MTHNLSLENEGWEDKVFFKGKKKKQAATKQTTAWIKACKNVIIREYVGILSFKLSLKKKNTFFNL